MQSKISNGILVFFLIAYFPHENNYGKLYKIRFNAHQKPILATILPVNIGLMGIRFSR